MKKKTLFSAVVLSTVLAAGFLTVWGYVGITALESGSMIVLKNNDHDWLPIRADGTALLAHSEDGAVSYRDLEGRPVAISEEAPLGWLSAASLPASLPWRSEYANWEERARVFNDGRTPHTAWYFITDGRPDGQAYFVGYDSYRKTRIGYLGRAGFRAELPPAEEQFPFAGATTNMLRVFCPDQDGRYNITAHRGTLSANRPTTSGLVYVFGLDQTIYQADLRSRTVRTILQERELRALAMIEDVTDPRQRNWRLAVRTDTQVLVLDKHGKEERRYPIPEELRDQKFTFGEATTGEAVMRWDQEYDMMEEEEAYRLFWVRADGRSRAVAGTLPHKPFREMRYLWAALLPSPLVLDVVGVIHSHSLHEDGLTPTFASALVRTWEEFWPAGVLAQLLATGLALLCYRRQVRYGVSRTERIIWPLFVLLLGLPGWIGYRFGRSWPVLEACPECGAAVPRDRESCRCCTHDFPRPALKGTEVFA